MQYALEWAIKKFLGFEASYLCRLMSLPLDKQKAKLLMTNSWKLTFYVEVNKKVELLANAGI